MSSWRMSSSLPTKKVWERVVEEDFSLSSCGRLFDPVYRSWESRLADHRNAIDKDENGDFLVDTGHVDLQEEREEAKKKQGKQRYSLFVRISIGFDFRRLRGSIHVTACMDHGGKHRPSINNINQMISRCFL